MYNRQLMLADPGCSFWLHKGTMSLFWSRTGQVRLVRDVRLQEAGRARKLEVKKDVARSACGRQRLPGHKLLLTFSYLSSVSDGV